MKTISKDEYDVLRESGLASVIDDLPEGIYQRLSARNVTWDGHYWAIYSTSSNGTVLAPVNVTFDSARGGE